MTKAGTITTVAGTGTPGYSGDGGLAERAELNNPYFVVFDREGNLLFADTDNNTLRRVDRRTGRISTLAGSGMRGFTGDGGPARKAAFDNLVAFAVSEDGNLYLVDRLNRRVRKVDQKTGSVTTVAGDGSKAYGGDGGPGEKAQLKEPHDCVLDGRNGLGAGLLICDVADCRVRRLDLRTGIITTFAGTGERRSAGNGGPAVKASFAGSRAIARHPGSGDIYICEREGNRIRRVEGGTGTVVAFAGCGEKGFTGDGGPASEASFNGPKGLCCDRRGSLFVVDTENHAIRCIDGVTGVITTVAGGRCGSDGDGGMATAAGLNRPHGVAIGPDGALYIADSENHRIRRVALS